MLGLELGLSEGADEILGEEDGWLVGLVVGNEVGFKLKVGLTEGAELTDSDAEGWLEMEGDPDGQDDTVGLFEGCSDGLELGAKDGWAETEGRPVGEFVGYYESMK